MCKLRELLLYILLRKEVNCMAVVYATLIIKGLKTIEQVPALIKSQVEEILVANISRVYDDRLQKHDFL